MPVKRRAVASDLCSKGRVSVNGRDAKPGKELQVGDLISLRFRSGAQLDCEVKELPSGGVRKDRAPTLYAVVKDTRSSADTEE